jgi:PKD repeat protein
LPLFSRIVARGFDAGDFPKETFMRTCLIGLILSISLIAGVAQAAATAANRAAKIEALARSADGMSGGGFVGMVPGNLITDPVSISTSLMSTTIIDYGDGATVTYQPGETPAHTYAQPGFYKPVISSKTLGTIMLAFQVPFDSNKPNVFGFGVVNRYDPATGQQLEGVEFLPVYDGSAILDFGDGSPPQAVDPVANPTHTYPGKGTYTAIFTVTNNALSESGSAKFLYPLSANNAVGNFPQISITDKTAVPNPATAGTPVTLSATITSSNVTGELFGSLDFGDGSAPFTFSDYKTLTGSVEHTYAANGVYKIVLTVTGDTAKAQTHGYVIVGTGTAVNSINGLISSATVDPATGTAALQLIVDEIAGATTATTEFDDTLGRAAPIDGLTPSRTFAEPTLTVATSTAKDAAGNPLGRIRKMVAVGGEDVGDSGALKRPADTRVKVKQLKGKFLFASDSADQIALTGSILLPAGFDPAKTGGNVLAFGAGNITDSVNVDAKGKPIGTPTGAKGRFKKIQVKYPKLTGPATGTEIAQITVQMALQNMDTLGFDTEGITNAPRADEGKLKTLSRFVQVNMLFAGVPYEVYAPVIYKLSKNRESGQLASRKQ